MHLHGRLEGASPRLATAILLVVLHLVGCGQTGAASSNLCERRIATHQSTENTLLVNTRSGPLRPLAPEFFGFNLEWVDFQQSLWDSTRQEVRKSVVDWLRPFEGAVYRYPGGTGSNSFNWRDGLGSLESRPVKKRVDWLGPIRNEFGIDEYLDFVQRVKGQAWVVLNLVGTGDSEQKQQQVADDAAAFVAYADSKARSGSPRITRWELGNELDRGNVKWSPDKYSARALAIVTAVTEKSPTAKFVSMLQDWPAQEKKYSVSAYNHAVMGSVPAISEFAHHLYYEEMAWDTAERRVRLLCESASVAESAGLVDPQFWITEHARGLPGSRNAEWKRNWPKTANLEAALIVAEAYIVATQIPEARGLFLHSLGSAHGPWPLFNAGSDKSLHPSAVYWGLRILRDSMLPLALETTVNSRKDASTIGGFNVRGAVLSNSVRSRFTVWAVNRLGNKSPLTLHLPSLAGRGAEGRMSFITSTDADANNHLSSDRIVTNATTMSLRFDSNGNALIELPPYSVSALEFSPQ